MARIRMPGFITDPTFWNECRTKILLENMGKSDFYICALLIPSCLFGRASLCHTCKYMHPVNLHWHPRIMQSLSLCCYISIQQSVVISFSFRRDIYLFFPPRFRHLGQDPRSYWGSHKGLVQASSILICFSLNSWSPHLMASCCYYCNFSVSKAGCHVAWEGTLWENQA